MLVDLWLGLCFWFYTLYISLDYVACLLYLNWMNWCLLCWFLMFVWVVWLVYLFLHWLVWFVLVWVFEVCVWLIVVICCLRGFALLFCYVVFYLMFLINCLLNFRFVYFGFDSLFSMIVSFCWFFDCLLYFLCVLCFVVDLCGFV